MTIVPPHISTTIRRLGDAGICKWVAIIPFFVVAVGICLCLEYPTPFPGDCNCEGPIVDEIHAKKIENITFIVLTIWQMEMIILLSLPSQLTHYDETTDKKNANIKNACLTLGTLLIASVALFSYGRLAMTCKKYLEQYLEQMSGHSNKSELKLKYEELLEQAHDTAFFNREQAIFYCDQAILLNDMDWRAHFCKSELLYEDGHDYGWTEAYYAFYLNVFGEDYVLKDGSDTLKYYDGALSLCKCLLFGKKEELETSRCIQTLQGISAAMQIHRPLQDNVASVAVKQAEKIMKDSTIDSDVNIDFERISHVILSDMVGVECQIRHH